MIVSEQFVRSTAANVAFWRERLAASTTNLVALDGHSQNLLRGVQFGLALPTTRVAASELAINLFDFVEQRGYWREWQVVVQAALDRCLGEDVLLKCRLTSRLGQLQRLDGQWIAAVASHRAAERLAEQANLEIELAHAHLDLSEDYRLGHEYSQAESHGQLALQAFAKLELQGKEIAACLNTLGLIAHYRGQYALAVDRLSQATAQLRRLQRPVDLARTLVNLANALAASGQYDSALQSYADAAQILDETASEFDKVILELSQGTVYFELGRLDDAEAAFRRADSPFLRQSLHLYQRALTANNLGNVLLARGRLDEAETRLQGSIRLWRELGDEVMLGNSLGTLGETLVQQSRPLEAAAAYEEALSLFMRHPDNAFAKRLATKYGKQRAHLVGDPAD